jgi:hypothetical protein
VRISWRRDFRKSFDTYIDVVTTDGRSGWIATDTWVQDFEATMEPVRASHPNVTVIDDYTGIGG